MNKQNEAISLLPSEQPDSSHPMALPLRALQVGAGVVICVAALVIFGPFWIVEGVRRRFGKPY